MIIYASMYISRYVCLCVYTDIYMCTHIHTYITCENNQGIFRLADRWWTAVDFLARPPLGDRRRRWRILWSHCARTRSLDVSKRHRVDFWMLSCKFCSQAKQPSFSYIFYHVQVGVPQSFLSLSSGTHRTGRYLTQAKQLFQFLQEQLGVENGGCIVWIAGHRNDLAEQFLGSTSFLAIFWCGSGEQGLDPWRRICENDVFPWDHFFHPTCFKTHKSFCVTGPLVLGHFQKLVAFWWHAQHFGDIRVHFAGQAQH